MIGQFVTLSEARLMATILIMGGMPVAPEDPSNDYHNDKSGIYLRPWVHPSDPEPSVGEARQYQYRLKNGYGGDIGLIFAVAEGQAAPPSPTAIPPTPAGPPRYDIAVHREIVAYKEWLMFNPDQA